ncbi:MAG: PadR family transcriptional regulator [Thermonemataceae bacterium]
MKGTNIGELEELVLLSILLLQEEAYLLRIQEVLKAEAQRSLSLGSLHNTLSRLEKKDLLQSSLGGATKARGGRRKRFYELTNTGKQTLTHLQEIRTAMWKQVPAFALKLNFI